MLGYNACMSPAQKYVRMLGILTILSNSFTQTIYLQYTYLAIHLYACLATYGAMVAVMVRVYSLGLTGPHWDSERGAAFETSVSYMCQSLRGLACFSLRNLYVAQFFHSPLLCPT